MFDSLYEARLLNLCMSNCSCLFPLNFICLQWQCGSEWSAHENIIIHIQFLVLDKKNRNVIYRFCVNDRNNHVLIAWYSDVSHIIMLGVATLDR
jgi:hypothetical protein